MNIYSVHWKILPLDGNPWICASRYVTAPTRQEAERKALELVKADYPHVHPRYIKIEYTMQLTTHEED